MNIALIVVGALAGVLFIASAILLLKERTGCRAVQLFGSLCWVMVVLTHVAESFRLLPEMGWGLPRTPGHYLDLCSAILGLILLPLGYAMAKRRHSS